MQVKRSARLFQLSGIQVMEKLLNFQHARSSMKEFRNSPSLSRTRVRVLTRRSFECVQILSIRGFVKEVAMYGRKKTLEFASLNALRQAKARWRDWVVKIRKMMCMFNDGCRSCCGSDMFVVPFLKLFFLRRNGDGSGRWLLVLRCSPMGDTSNTLSTCHLIWLYAAMMILSCFSIVSSFLDLGVRIVSNFFCDSSHDL